MDSYFIQVRLPPELEDVVKEAAKKQKQTVSEYLRSLVDPDYTILKMGLPLISMDFCMRTFESLQILVLSRCRAKTQAVSYWVKWK